MKVFREMTMKVGFGLLISGLFLLVGVVPLLAQPSITATLKAIPESYAGQCPAKIKFEGVITVKNITRPPLKLQYKFIRSDGASAPVNTLTFDKDGSKRVNTTWTLGGPELPTYTGWEAIKVVYPQDVESNHADFKIQCRGQGKPQDLTIKITQCPQSAKAGQDLGSGFQVVATNLGDTAVKDVAVDIVLRNDASCPSPAPYAVYSPNYSNGVLLKGGREHVSLNPGQTLNVKLNGTNTIPTDTPSGGYYLCAVIDAGNKVAEANERNNCACCPLKIAGGAAKPEITGYREQCGKKGSNVTILGKNFDTNEGKGVALGGHGIHVDLPVVSWSDTIIVAQIPNDPKIQEGQWYYIGVERANHTEWLSNISKNITICR